MTTSLPLISVIIPSYNRCSLLARTLQSIFAQTYSAFEIILLDDGSTDGTYDLIQQLQDERLVYFHYSKNQGHPRIMKDGYQAARGEIVLFLGSDDMLATPDLFEDVVQRFQSVPSDIWVITYPGVDRNALSSLQLDFEPFTLNLAEYLSHSWALMRDQLHFYRSIFVREQLRHYDKACRFFTSFLDVYLETDCRQLIVPIIGMIAGFQGDNLTQGKGGANYDLWAEQAAIYQMNRFSTYEPARGTRWWQRRLLSALFWSLTGQTLGFRERHRVAWKAVLAYQEDFGLDLELTKTLVVSLLPSRLGSQLRRWRDRNRTRRPSFEATRLTSKHQYVGNVVHHEVG